MRWPRSGSGFQSHLREAVAEGVTGQAEEARGLALVAVGAAEGLADEFLLVLIESHAVGQEVRIARDGGAGTRRAFDFDIGGVKRGISVRLVLSCQVDP